jgi:predicted HicB family RNase H-like nuclease
VSVRIHYEVPDDLHRRAKAAAALLGVSLKTFVIDALGQATHTAEKRRPKGR